MNPSEIPGQTEMHARFPWLISVALLALAGPAIFAGDSSCYQPVTVPAQETELSANCASQPDCKDSLVRAGYDACGDIAPSGGWRCRNRNVSVTLYDYACQGEECVLLGTIPQNPESHLVTVSGCS